MGKVRLSVRLNVERLLKLITAGSRSFLAGALRVVFIDTDSNEVCAD